jgi:FlaA1/EpsC-like NDP-sugar epimerase
MMENNPVEAVLTNIRGTRILADLSMEFGVSKFIMISTDKAVNPTNVMGASKRIAEIYTQALNQANSARFITTRFGNVLGSNGSVIPLFKSQIEKGGPVTITHPDVTRFFMTIPEACQLVLEAGAHGKGGEIFIFDMGRPVKILDLARKMIQLSGLTPGKDIQIRFTGLRPGEKLFEELLNIEENTIHTHHPLILIARVRESNLAEVRSDIDELTHLATDGSEFDLIRKMKQMVPEYISQNSVFEQLDQ